MLMAFEMRMCDGISNEKAVITIKRKTTLSKASLIALTIINLIPAKRFCRNNVNDNSPYQ